MSLDDQTPSLDDDTILLAFQLEEYLASAGRGFRQSQDQDTLDALTYAVTHYTDPRPARTDGDDAPGVSTRTSSQPPPAPRWPPDWATDAALVRFSIKAFKARTAQLRQDPSYKRTLEKGKSAVLEDDAAGELPALGPPKRRPSSLSRGRTAADDSAIAQILQHMKEEGRRSDQKFAAIQRDIQDLQFSRKSPFAAERSHDREQQRFVPAYTEDTLFRTDKQDKFVAGDIGYFHPFYNEKSAETGAHIEHAGKDTYFRDVYVFTERVKDVGRFNSKVKENLQICLRGEALQWYTSELSLVDKEALSQDLKNWVHCLIDRFKPPMEEGIRLLNKERYTLEDASRHREPREYGQARLRAAKIAETTDTRQIIMHMWMGLATPFRITLVPKPTTSTTIAEFMKSMDNCKLEMWATGKEHLRQPRGPPPNTSGRQRTGNQQQQRTPDSQQLMRSFLQNQAAQSSGAGNVRPMGQMQPQSQGYRNPPMQGGSTPLRAPFTGGSSTQQGNSYPVKPNPPPTYANKPQGPPNNQSQGQKPYFGPGFQRYAPPQAAYQTMIEEDTYGNEYPYTEEAYAQYLEQDPAHGYYGHGSDEPYQEDAAQEEPGHGPNEYEEVGQNFVDTRQAPMHPCQGCTERFESRNKLFKHLRKACWNKPKDREEPQALVAGDASSAQPDEAAALRVIESKGERVSGTGLAFKQYHYAVLPLSFSPDMSEAKTVCADTGCTMSMADKRCIPEGTEIKKLPKQIPIRGVGAQIHRTDEFAVLTFYLKGKDLKDQEAVAAITREIHIVDDLQANLLIGADILTPEGMTLDYQRQQITIGSCEDLKVAFNSYSRQEPNLRRTIRAQGNVTLKPKQITRVPVHFQGNLPGDRDFFFEPKLKSTPRMDLGLDGGAFTHMVDASLSFVNVYNASYTPVVLPRRTRLGEVLENRHEGCYAAAPDMAALSTSSAWSTIKHAVRKSAKKAAVGATAVLAAATVMQEGKACRPELPVSVSTVGAPTNQAAPWIQDGLLIQEKSGPDPPPGIEFPKTAAPTVPVDPQLEHRLDNGITVYGKLTVAQQLAAVTEKYQDVFTDQGATVDIPEEEWMPIPLKPGAKPSPSKVYNLSTADRAKLDETFDKLHEQGKMEFSKQPTEFAYPVFIVWRTSPDGTKKGRVVVDIRGLNAITESDSYPLPLQADIIALVSGHPYISVVDCVGWFHQFRVQRRDRHKLTVVSHRGQEQSSVALMGYKGSPPYVQRQTDKLLRPFKDFAKAYVDDIIVFSHSLEEHLEHLERLLSMFREKRVNLSPGKSFLGYPSVRLLGQRVDALGMTTSEDKIKAISEKAFPEHLRDLETYLGMTGWLRHTIAGYAQVAEPLQKRKTLLTKGLGRGFKGLRRKLQSTKLRYDPTPEERESFRLLQEAFELPTFLYHFDPTRKLYLDLDASKQFGFAAIIYHVDGDPDKDWPSSKVQPIMFLSKCLNSAEKNYWPTELEVAGVVWVVKKTRHLIESSLKPPVVIYTDHSAAVPISKQTSLKTTSTDKLNLRLVRASQYLSAFNIELRHKAGKTNVVPDALSRLEVKDPQPAGDKEDGILDILYGNADIAEQADTVHYLPDVVPAVYHATLVEMADEFKARIKEGYAKDKRWMEIITMLQTQELDPDAEDDEQRLPGINFRLRNELLYYVPGDGRDRLCIPDELAGEVIGEAHGRYHRGIHRVHDELYPSIFIRNMHKKIKDYVEHCHECQLNQTKRHRPFGSLNPIPPKAPFHTITMDFVLALPTKATDKDCLLTITCKYTKKVLLTPGQITYSAVDWANLVITALLEHDWGVPSAIISDRDRKFMSSFWRQVFQKLGTKILASTAYHPQTDGQSERTNQTVEIGLRFWITEHPDEDWTKAIPFLQFALNNSTSFATGFAPNELALGFRPKDTVGALLDLPPEDIERLRPIKRAEAEDMMAFSTAMSKVRYDHLHKARNFKAGDKVFLRLHHGYTLPDVTNRKLSNQRAGPFKILRKIGHLAYELELPNTMKIHPVISIAQLEPAPVGEDPFHRPPVNDEPPAVEMEFPEENPDQYEVERIADRRKVRRHFKYLVKWKGYGPQWNSWHGIEDLTHCMEFVDAYNERFPLPSGVQQPHLDPSGPQPGPPHAPPHPTEPRSAADATAPLAPQAAPPAAPPPRREGLRARRP